ncbi:hypothetical protein PHYPSEUDO_010584 [Phytophthora pseudosyringae]|uniref:Uncharacterized protein n=1 Tax=Phytophthora pseudosyringae TaxID=221518 RepID=A0A8T1V9X0_9STRA|nr:hypothetical protein PHYPSEUDO_010584 [Phytophthora pseudosyringae]
MPTTPVLRKLFTMADDEEKAPCTVVSVKGDATYCIEGPVCGGGPSKQVQGTCPAEGDAAIGHCVRTSRSFATGCVAPVDAQCVVSRAGRWECVFPIASSAPAATGKATPTPTGVAALSRDKNDLSTASKVSNTDSGSGLGKAPNAALNVVVGASCCILALVGLVLAKKRRNAKKPSGSKLPRSNSSTMTL